MVYRDQTPDLWLESTAVRSTRDSRLTRNIRETKGYTYSPFSSSNTRAKTGSFLAGAFVRNEVTGPTLLEIFYELDRMRVLPVEDEELKAAKEYSTGNFSVELAT